MLLLDVDLPGLHGLGVLRRLAHDGVRQHTRVIMLIVQSAESEVLYMRRLILHHFYRASIRKACVHTLSTGCSEKNDVKLTAVCIIQC